MKKLITCTAALFSILGVSAQFVADYLKAADNYFTNGDYASAAEYYEKYLGGSKAGEEAAFNPYAPQTGNRKAENNTLSKEKAAYQLAECYRMLHFPAKAEAQYKILIGGSISSAYPLIQFHYASQLRALGKYADAEKHFSAFLSGYKANDSHKKNAERELKNLQFIQTQMARKDLSYYSIHKAGGVLNATGASYAPAWLNSSTLLFTSTRPLDTTVKTKVYTNRVYQASYEGGVAGAISLASLPQEKGMQQGVVTITPDGSTLFLTKWAISGEKKTAALYASMATKEGWAEPVKLGESINMPGTNTQQPFVTADGKYLLFASNRDGGQGGYDLWYAPLTNGQPGSPVNMGPVINTVYDEQAPFLHAASSTLVFSSNGRVGMGGYDFFQAKGVLGGSWTEPVNMGYPVNSVKDDLYLISRGPAKNMLEDAMLSSDRDAACCLELFAVKKIRPARQISGRVVSCDPAKPLTSATVSVTDPVTNKTIFTKSVGADGSYNFVLEDHQPLKVQAEAGGFQSGTADMKAPADPEEIQFRYPDICLQPDAPKVNETVVLNNVYYDYDKADLKPESFPALDELVALLNKYPAMTIEIGAHTDSKGRDSYNQKLSEARAESVVKYLVDKGIAPERLTAKGYGETQPVAPNEVDGKDNPAGREKNRRTEFKVLKTE